MAKYRNRGMQQLRASGLTFALAFLVTTSVQAFHFPWDQGHDTTDWNEPPPIGPCEGPLCTPCSATGSPLYIPTGHFVWRETDLEIFGRQSLSLRRSYNSNDPRDGIFGNGWTSGCEEALYQTTSYENDEQGDPVVVTRYVLRLEDGKRYEFAEQDDGSFMPPTGRYEQLVGNADGTATLIQTNGATKTYSASGKLLQKVDPNGEALTYNYDGDDQLIRIADEYDRFLDFAYNTGGRVDTVTDFTGRTWSYLYDGDGNLLSVTNPLGGVREYEYQRYSPTAGGEDYYQLTRVTDESGVELTSVSYSADRVSSYSELSNVYSIAYNTTARTVTKTDSLGSRWTYTYNDDQLITREVNPGGGVTVSTYDDQGNLITTVDEEGRAWSATYDAQGRPLSETDPLGNTVTWGYAGTYEWPASMTSPSGRVTAMEYDSEGNLLSFTDPSGARVTNTWSPDGILLNTTDAAGNTTVFTSDVLGRRVATTDPIGRTSTVTYDELSRVVTETDVDGNATTYEYDGLGRVARVSDRNGASIEYSYDAAGRLTAMRDQLGNTNLYTYDAFGRNTSRTAPDGRTTARSYRVDNLLDSVTHGDGTTVSFNYDANKRLSSKGVGTETYTYAYDGRGALTRVDNSAGTLTRQYDAAGQLVGESFNGVALAFTLNADGERTQLTALGGTTQYQRDGRGLIESIVDDSGTYGLAYDVNGLRTSLTYPNGTVATYARDADRQLTSIAHSGVFSDTRTYSYDNVGNIVQQAINGIARTFDYDPEERLIGATYPGATFDYEYDEAGNLTIDGRTYDSANKLIQDDERSFAYDARGNLLSKTDIASGARVAYEWDAQNQLVAVSRFDDATATVPSEVVEFRYGPLGRRVGKTVNGTEERYVYDGYNRIGVLDTAGNVLERVVFGPDIDEPLGKTSTNGDRFLYADRQQSIIAVSDDTAVLEEYSYTPYGALQSGAPGESDFGYTGREMDGPDLYFYRSRYYDPTIQRFLSEDPIGLSGGTNFYAYVDGNPVRNTDPLGLQRGSPEWCRRQRERIRNIENKIRERQSELREDPLNLPESCPGDDVRPSLSKRGHRRLINMDKANLAAQRALYQAYCQNNPPPPPVPVTEPETAPEPSPAPNTNPFSGVDWGAVAVGVGIVVVIGAAIYFSGGLAAPAFASARRRKRDFAQIDKQEVLHKLAELDVGSWRFMWENKDTRHIGPMAEEFRQAFGLGKSDKVIELVDTNGVLYAAVQALHAAMQEKEAQIEALREELARLKAKVESRDS